MAVVAWIGFSVAVTAERPEGAMMQFDHIGVVTTDKKPGERFVSATRVWVTDFQTHPFHVEWLRYEPDSPVKGPVRTMPHVAYRVDNIAKAAKAKNLKVLLEPFDGGIAKVGFFQTDDGAVVELMEYDLRKTK
ncbi:MAG: hypothetical protein LLF97_07620 [Planctomycetaceae bacterium]|nr:hypothetical protein [Planctomycetaceae bacterium]